MYLSIAVKLLIGMLGLILFLRISGKTQMAQLTPLDSVNSFVLGALVGGVIYNPDTPSGTCFSRSPFDGRERRAALRCVSAACAAQSRATR
ncbi:MAG: hypothetical protein ACLS37_11795 [Alistipes sp.]